ncbi:MAG TPA: hypothetical protein VKV95_02325 [Terriglobia bacterium]|nr:hypothetical protein [Terriglobia bacterium]
MSAIFRACLQPFNGHNPMWSLVPLSVLIGIGMLWVFRLTSNQAAITKVKAQLMACLYEMRLFVDDPVLVWRAQWGLISANVKYIGLMLVPALVMTAPMILILGQLECFYGHLPIEPGQAAIVTVQMTSAGVGQTPELRTPDGIVLETPPVHIDGGRQISWRIRAQRPTTGILQFVFPDEQVDKSIIAGRGPQYVSERRVSSALAVLWYPGEKQLATGPVDWIELRYPPATVHALGLDFNWLIWLLVLSMISALLLKRRFRVSF